MKKITALAAILALGTGAAFASDMDTNGDGAVSFDEMLAAYPDATEATFAAIDADASGMLSDAEIMAAQDAGLIPAEG